MSTLRIMMFLTAAATAATIFLSQGAWAEMIEIGTSFETPGTELQGTVWLSHEGKIRVRWDGITLNGGSVRMSLQTADPRISATFPAFKLDLQKLLGREWMKGIDLSAGAGSGSLDFGTGAAELQLGKISLSLSQTLHDAGGWSWTLRETASGSYVRRRTATGETVETVPVKLAIDSEVVDRLSEEVAVTLSIGAYGSVASSLSGADPKFPYGAYVAAELRVGERLALGGRLEGTQFLDGSSRELDATTFVKYTLRRGRFENALKLTLGSTFGHSGSFNLTLAYTIRF